MVCVGKGNIMGKEKWNFVTTQANLTKLNLASRVVRVEIQ